MVVRALAFALVVIAASPSWACGILERAEPKVGSVVAPVSAIRLVFSEAFVPGQSSVTLADAAEKPVETQPFSAQNGDSVMALNLANPLPAGDYKVHWNVLWKDCGSATEGYYGFSIKP